MTGTISAVEQIRTLRAELETANRDLATARTDLGKAWVERDEARDAVDNLTADMALLRGQADAVIGALHLLHEQAHGDVPWRTCMADPCRTFGSNVATGMLESIQRTAGPAPLPMVVAA